MLDFKVGDIVHLDCPNLIQNTRCEKFIGQIIDIFDLLDKQGNEGNLEIRIKNKTSWVCYKPLQDGGTLTLIERKL